MKAVIPMFLTLGIGYLVRLSKIATDHEMSVFNKVTFRALFPILMFMNIYSADIEEIVNPKLIIYTVGGIMTVYFLGTFVALRMEKDNKSRGALIQAIYRSNFVIMGLPIATNIYGHTNVGVTALLVSIVVPMFNVLAVITLESYRGSRVRISVILKGLARNPLILGAVAGILCTVLSIRLPGVVEETASSVAAAATPVSLIILGASFKFNTVRECRRNLIIVLVLRLIIVPGLMLTGAALLGIRNIAFVSLVGVFASPCAISSFTMALEMDSDADLAGNAVIFTSAFACVTMFGWLLLFRSFGMF